MRPGFENYCRVEYQKRTETGWYRCDKDEEWTNVTITAHLPGGHRSYNEFPFAREDEYSAINFVRSLEAAYLMGKRKQKAETRKLLQEVVGI